MLSFTGLERVRSFSLMLVLFSKRTELRERTRGEGMYGNCADEVSHPYLWQSSSKDWEGFEDRDRGYAHD